MTRRLILSVVSLIFSYGMATGTVSASVATPVLSQYDFTGTCTDCSLAAQSLVVASAELVLSNYTPGDSINFMNFVSFHYDGTNLVAAFTITDADVTALSGSMYTVSAAPENFFVVGPSASFKSSADDGTWCVNGAGTCARGAQDFGSQHLYALAPTQAVPEPLPVALLAGGLVVGLAARRRRR